MKFNQIIKCRTIKNAYKQKEGIFSDTLFEHKIYCFAYFDTDNFQSKCNSDLL